MTPPGREGCGAPDFCDKNPPVRRRGWGANQILAKSPGSRREGGRQPNFNKNSPFRWKGGNIFGEGPFSTCEKLVGEPRLLKDLKALEKHGP